MATTTTPTTPIDLLRAVNLLLGAIGQSQVSTLITADLKEDARKAIAKLGDTSVEVQSRGWEFNTDKEVTLDPAVDGTIALPSNCMTVLTVHSSRWTHLVARDGKLYWPRKQTYVIGKSVKVDMVVALEFDQMPQPARWYVTCLAGRRFATTELASSSSYQFTATEEKDALLRLEQYDATITDRSLAETNPHIGFMRAR